MKKYILRIILIFGALLSVSMTVYAFNNINIFYFNNNYLQDNININKELIKKGNLKKAINKCLYDIAPKYYSSPKNQRKYCIFRLKELLNEINHPLKNKYPYIKEGELNFLWKEGKNIINNGLFKYLNIKELNTKLENSDDSNLVNYNNSGIFIKKNILKDLILLNADYKKQFHKGIILNSGFRSVKDQKAIYERYQKIYGIHQKIAAKPGYSEHHLGTAIDIKRIFIKNKQGKIIDNNYTWIKKNSWKYGFIQSYDENCIKEGIINEDWHYRWVGKYIATQWKQWKYKNPNKCNIFFIKEINQK